MKPLYTYLIQEKLGTLREEYDYTKLIEKVAEFIVSKYEYYKSAPNGSFIAGPYDFIDYFPQWIEAMSVEVDADKNETAIGYFVPSYASFQDGKLIFPIFINIKNVDRFAKTQTDPSPEILLTHIQKTLQHELKHAFDEWIVRIKKLPEVNSKRYFDDKYSISKSLMSRGWKVFFSKSIYLMSRFEKTAYQQEYLQFYKEHPVGKMFIHTLKVRHGNIDNLYKSMIKVDDMRYVLENYNIYDDICKALDNTLTQEDIQRLVSNIYLDFLHNIYGTIQMVSKLSEEQCENALKMLEKVNQKSIKIYQSGTYKERFIKTLERIERDIEGFLTKKILKRVM